MKRKASFDNLINTAEYEKLKEDLQVLQEKHENCEDWRLKYEEMEAELKNTKESGASQLAKSAEELKTLNTELSDTKKSLKEKNSELEEVRDMLRTVGNELVDAKDEIKGFSSKQTEEAKAVKLELDNLRHKNATMVEAHEIKNAELKNRLDSLNKKVEHLKASFKRRKRERADDIKKQGCQIE